MVIKPLSNHAVLDFIVPFAYSIYNEPSCPVFPLR